MDIMEEYSVESFNERVKANIKDKIVPLLETARKSGLFIIHAPHGCRIPDEIRPLENEPVMEFTKTIFEPDPEETQALHGLLQKRGIKTLFYAGYASNRCLLYRSSGIVKMYELGYEIIIIRDCSIAFEMPETLESEMFHTAAVHTVERLFGKSTTLKDFQRAFGCEDI